MIQKIADLPQRQQVMVGLLVAGGLFVFWYYVISPLGAQVTALQGREAELTETIQTLEAVRARRPQVEKEVEELEKELAQLREKLPDEKETADIVRRVEELAVGSNLDIRSFTPQATIKKRFL
jgi:Tfp pilus assembly protein PilO